MNKFIHVEYDPEYSGGNYNKVGQFAHIPAESQDIEATFEKQTGLSRNCIIFYTLDEEYDENGNYIQ